MNKSIFQKLLPHLIAVVIFLLVAVIFCSPALSGKVINQSDVVHWKGMAQQSLEYKEQHGHFPLWTNSMFGGMPAYQIAMESQNKITPGFFHYIFMLGLPKPIGFFFLICLMFYFLCQAFRINPWISILGALAYGYATYNPIIVAVGHDTKMLAMAYMPALLGALVLLYEKKYWLGGALTALFSVLLIGMNHLQITYYFLIVAGFMTLMYLYRWIKEKEFRHLGLALAIALVAGVSGVLANATNFFITYDYSKATMRNGTLNLDTTTTSNQTKKAGLPIDYAFSWSYGKTETFTLLFPGIYGGSSGGELDANSKIAANLTEKGVPEEQAGGFAQSMPSYWGPQPSTSGPVYLGAIICFLFIFGMVYLKTWHRWWMLAAVVLAIMMSWGKNFEGFNTFLFNYLPFYNKFRAPSMILVIPQLCFALLSAMALQRFFFGEDSKEERWKQLKLATYITGGFLVVGIMLYFSFSYKGANDESIQQYFQQSFQNQQAATEVYSALKADRQSLFGGDLVRSIILIALAAGILALVIRGKIKFATAIGALLVLNLFDLFGVGKRYLNEDDFVEPDMYDAAFMPSQADMEIKRDTGYYRVLNLTQDVFNDAITSYHHNSVGGYHPAKLSITEDLLNYHLRKQPMNINVLNMLNTKYVITSNQQNGQPVAQTNPDALGAVWFVKGIRFEKGWLNVMNALNNFNPRDTAILEASSQNMITVPQQQDSAATIQLINNENDVAIYQSNSSANQFAVFSEIFYDRGWKAYIDGKEVPIIRTNYVLRGFNVPAGKHEIKFEFKPESYYTGERISLFVNIAILIFFVIAGIQIYRKERSK
jgi:hypothetical protein